jgi:hypothetical protein
MVHAFSDLQPSPEDERAFIIDAHGPISPLCSGLQPYSIFDQTLIKGLYGLIVHSLNNHSQ